MLTLALDTSSDSGSIAILRDQRLIAVVSTSAEETYSSRIFRQLEFLLAELSVSLDQFDLFAVNAGPGSFTGLRVGLTLAKAWAEVYGRPVAAVSGLEAVAAQAVADSGLIISVLDARRGQIYAGAYRQVASISGVSHLVADGENVVITPQEFLVWVGAPQRLDATIATVSVAWFASIISGSSARLPSGDAVGVQQFHPRQVRQVSHVLAPIIGSLGHSQFVGGEAVDALHLDANYVRRSDAELNWKGK